MKVFLVMWSEVDSGYEIMGAYLSQERAQAHADELNLADRNKMIQSTEDWIIASPSSFGPHKTYESPEAARQSTLNYVNRNDFNNYSVQEVEVKE